MNQDKNNNFLHFTAGTPARVALQIMGLSFLTYSVVILIEAETTIAFVKGILFFSAGCIVFLLREHVSNSDYFKEFSKYAEENLIFTEENTDEPDGYV